MKNTDPAAKPTLCCRIFCALPLEMFSLFMKSVSYRKSQNYFLKSPCTFLHIVYDSICSKERKAEHHDKGYDSRLAIEIDF